MPCTPKPTVVPANYFDPSSDAKVLNGATIGLGTDENAIIEVLTRRTLAQRLKIASEYKNIYRRDLVADLANDTSLNFKNVLMALMTPWPKFYAKELHDAMSGLLTDVDALIEIMCTLKNNELKEVKQAYKRRYERDLEEDLRSHTSGYFKKFLIALSEANRSENVHVDKKQAEEDAMRLYKAGEDRLGTDEKTFITLLTSRSFPQLAAIFKEYKLIKGNDFQTAINREFSGNIKKALLALVKLVQNTPEFFAECLHKSMKGLGTKDRQLIRIIVMRCEIDLGDISDTFESKYGESLQSWIEDDTSGDYMRCLLGLLNIGVNRTIDSATMTKVAMGTVKRVIEKKWINDGDDGNDCRRICPNSRVKSHHGTVCVCPHACL